jgi:uncharacterized protein YndB with AHSA1/START domain
MNYKPKIKVMAEGKESNSDFAGRELSINRLLNAPVELVWEVFINPEHIKNWWGPNGFTNTIYKMEVKPGGVWEFMMHGPDGTNYPNKSVFKEVVPHRLIVFEHYAPNFTTTINFVAEGGKTRINWHMLFESKELFEMIVKNHKADKGLEQNIEKLEAYLTQPLNMASEPFVIERTFNAPIEKVWRAITNKDEMKQWCFDIADFKPEVGFEFTFNGKTSEGKIKIHLCKVTEVVTGSKLTYSWAYLGHDGISYVTWELFDEGTKTRLKLTHASIENLSATPNNDFAKENFAAGWTHIIGTSLNTYLG